MSIDKTRGDILRKELAASAQHPGEQAAVMLLNATSLPDDDRFGALVAHVGGLVSVANWPTLLHEPCTEMLSAGHQRMVWAAVTLAGGGSVDYDRACQPLDEDNAELLRTAIGLTGAAV